MRNTFFSSLARHYSRGDQICPELLIIEGATVIRRTPYLAVHGYRVGLFGNEGLELSERLLQNFPQDTIEYHPQFILYHDFVSSWKELWLKAKRMAHSQMSTQVRTNQELSADQIQTDQTKSKTSKIDHLTPDDVSSLTLVSMSNAQEAEAHIKQALQRYKEYHLMDDRSIMLKLYARALNRVYLLLIALHRFLDHSK